MYMKLQLRFKEPPECNEVKSLNITLCCKSFLIFLIHILIISLSLHNYHDEFLFFPDSI